MYGEKCEEEAYWCGEYVGLLLMIVGDMVVRVEVTYVGI